MKWEYIIIQQNAATLNPGTFQLWEGKKTKLGDSSDITLYGSISQLGRMGWEIISTHARSDFIVEYVLKRPIEVNI